MKAVVFRRFGAADALELVDTEAPTPGEGQVLVRVHAASLNAMDWHFLKGRPRLIRLVLGRRVRKGMGAGHDLAGIVEANGAGATRFAPGDRVFGTARGSLAELAAAKETALARIPDGVSFEDAAATPVAGLTALQALRDTGRLEAGRKLLINGAAGGVGSFAVQIGKALGAEVTAVCSGAAVPLVRRLGADRAIDYEREDFIRSGGRYDLILDLAATHGRTALRRLLEPDGRIAAAGGSAMHDHVGRWLGRVLADMARSRFSRQKLAIASARLKSPDLDVLAAMIAGGSLAPAIERRYRLEETAEAMRHLSGGHSHGKIVIQVAG